MMTDHIQTPNDAVQFLKSRESVGTPLGELKRIIALADKS